MSRRRRHERKTTSRAAQLDEESHDEGSDNAGSEAETSSDIETADFIPEGCLFCNETSHSFDENLSHMHQAHSLIVPFQSSLAVDLQTLISFLHMIIFNYRECICCGTRRRTIEAVQQHMTSTGHCRFDATGEMSEFYQLDSLASQTAESLSQPDDRILRLPSGKLLTHRSSSHRDIDPASRNRRRETSPANPSPLPAPEQPSNTEPQALTKRDRREQALTGRLSQLRAGDHMSLMHLPESQQRSLLLASQKRLDEGKRTDRREQRRLDNVGNKTAVHTKYYKQEVPVYMGG